MTIWFFRYIKEMLKELTWETTLLLIAFFEFAVMSSAYENGFIFFPWWVWLLLAPIVGPLCVILFFVLLFIPLDVIMFTVMGLRAIIEKIFRF